jgi:hypothetical protein
MYFIHTVVLHVCDHAWRGKQCRNFAIASRARSLVYTLSSALVKERSLAAVWVLWSTLSLSASADVDSNVFILNLFQLIPDRPERGYIILPPDELFVVDPFFPKAFS